MTGFIDRLAGLPALGRRYRGPLHEARRLQSQGKQREALHMLEREQFVRLYPELAAGVDGEVLALRQQLTGSEHESEQAGWPTRDDADSLRIGRAARNRRVVASALAFAVALVVMILVSKWR